jgi:hypothetical protein
MRFGNTGNATGEDFFLQRGDEIMLETARF